MAHPASGLTIDALLLVLPAPELGGAERQSLRVAEGLRRRGTRVLVAASRTLGCATPGLALPLAHDPARPAEEARARQRAVLAALLRRWRPDAAIVCCPLPGEGLGALEALSGAGVPTLAVHHLVRGDWSLGPETAEAMRGLRVRWAAVSTPAAGRLRALAGLDSVAALPNALPCDAPPPLPRRPEALLLQVGRLDERKGAHLAPAIARRIAPATLALAGAGPLSGQLAPALELGTVADLRPWLARARALLLPSAHEGMPLAVMEAVAAGCPVLATAEALEAWPDAAAWARLVPRDAAAIAAAFGAPLPDPRRAALLAEADALDRLETLLLGGRDEAGAPVPALLQADVLGESAAPFRGEVATRGAEWLALRADGPGLVRCGAARAGGSGWLVLPVPPVEVVRLDSMAPLRRARGEGRPAVRLWRGPAPPAGPGIPPRSG